MAKQMSLFGDFITSKTDKNTDKKTDKKTNKKKNEPKNSLFNSPPKVENKPKNKSKTETKVSEPTVLERWHKSNNNPPTDFRPVEFNTESKKPVRGFKTVGGYITNTPYYLNKSNKANGYLEWKYISSCSTLDKCPNGFPDCEHCKRK